MFRRFHNATTIIPVDTLPASGIAGVPYMLPDGTFWMWSIEYGWSEIKDYRVFEESEIVFDESNVIEDR